MLLYAFDPLCGWCFGIQPAMRLLHQTLPELPIELVMGGLVIGNRVGPYSAMEDYIRSATPRLTQVTGQAPSEAFWKLFQDPQAISNSAPPIRAVLQVQKRAPQHAVAFAHALIDAHFVGGARLDRLESVQELAQRFGVSLDLPDYAQTTDQHPDVQPVLRRARSMGIRSYPTFAVRARPDQAWHALPSTYEPQAFVAQIQGALAELSGE